MTNNKRIRIKAIRRDPPDIVKLSKALVLLAQAQAEKEAEAEHKAASPDNPPKATS